MYVHIPILTLQLTSFLAELWRFVNSTWRIIGHTTRYPVYPDEGNILTVIVKKLKFNS